MLDCFLAILSLPLRPKYVEFSVSRVMCAVTISNPGSNIQDYFETAWQGSEFTPGTEFSSTQIWS